MRCVALLSVLVLGSPFAMAVLPGEDDIEAHAGAGPNVDPGGDAEDMGEAAPSSATPPMYGPMSELETLKDCAKVTLKLMGSWRTEGRQLYEFIEVNLPSFLVGYVNFLCASLGDASYCHCLAEKDWVGSSVAHLFQTLESKIFRTSVLRNSALGLPPEDAALILELHMKVLHKPLPTGVDLNMMSHLVLPKDYPDLNLLSNVSMPNLKRLEGRSDIDHFPRHLVEGSQVASGEVVGSIFHLRWFGMYAMPLWMKPYIEEGHLRIEMGDYMWGSTGHDCLGWLDILQMNGFAFPHPEQERPWFTLSYFEKGQENPHPVPAHRPLRPFDVTLATAKDTSTTTPVADLKAPQKDQATEEETRALNILDLPPEIWDAFFRYLNNAQRLTLLAACPDCASSFLAVGLEGIMFRPTGDLPHQPKADKDLLMFCKNELDMFSQRPLIHDDDFTFSIAWPTRNHGDVIRYHDSEKVVHARTPVHGLSLLAQGQRMAYETSMNIKRRFRFEPIFDQKKYQDFWAQATVTPAKGCHLVIQKTASGFACIPTDTHTLKQNFTIVHDFGHLKLACAHIHIIDEMPGFDKHKAEVDAFFDALRANVRCFEIFMDYVRNDGGEILQSYGPCHMERAENMPSLPILKEMFRTLVRHKIEGQRYLQNHFLKMALGDELMALTQKFPSTAIQLKDARKAQPTEKSKE